MSWDLLVVTHDRPGGIIFEELLPKNYRSMGSIDKTESNMIVSRLIKGVEKPVFTIDCPQTIEAEDLPDEVASTVISPRYQLEISVPAFGSGVDRSLAKKIAKQFALQFRGAVYDPQHNKLLWPKNRTKIYLASTKEERIRVVTLTWYLKNDSGESASRLLKTLKTLCPEALPRRYGDSEPFQNKMKIGCEQDFIDFWENFAAIDTRRSLDWNAQSPCFGGHVTFPDKRDAYPSGEPVGVPGTTPCTVVSLDFDGRALHADERWTEAIVALFSTIATRLGAFYALGCVQRNVIAKRSLWYDGEEETLVMPRSFFAGLAPMPTWLAWFGSPYFEHVAPYFREQADQPSERSLLFRGGSQPMDSDELAGKFPTLPANLVFEERPEAPTGEPKIVAADFIPNF